MSRRSGAIKAIREAIVAASDHHGSGYRLDQIEPDDDLIDDLALDALELESLGLILEEVFAGISIDPQILWAGAWHRTPDSLADWCIGQADLAAQLELQRQRRRA